MDIANVVVALGGDTKNTVPKYRVTAAEIAVLQAIHGADAVSEIEPCGSVARANREERARIFSTYGRAKDNNDNRVVDLLFPGIAARVQERLDELDLVDEQFKTTQRVARPAPLPEQEVAAIEDEAIADFSLEDKTVAQLKQILAERGVEIPTGVRKTELIAMIRSSAVPATEQAEGEELDELPADDGVLS